MVYIWRKGIPALFLTDTYLSSMPDLKATFSINISLLYKKYKYIFVFGLPAFNAQSQFYFKINFWH